APWARRWSAGRGGAAATRASGSGRRSSGHGDLRRAAGDLTLAVALVIGLDEGALLLVVLRCRVRIPVDLPHVVRRGVVVRTEAPEAGRAELPRIAEHALLERVRCQVRSRHLQADRHLRHLVVDEIDGERGLVLA